MISNRCVFVFCSCVLFNVSCSSALPIWELLSKQEKMSFLYSIFANQVEDFCKTSAVKDCNEGLMRYGLNTMKNVPEDVLIHTDPYQRDANRIIWKTILQGHPLAHSHPSTRISEVAPTPNSYSVDDAFGDVAAATSVSIDNAYSVAPPERLMGENDSTKVEYNYPNNVTTSIRTFDAPIPNKEKHVSSQEEYFQNGNGTGKSILLTGPVVVRVYLNGTPVEDDVPVHHDEDLLQHQLTQALLPDST